MSPRFIPSIHPHPGDLGRHSEHAGRSWTSSIRLVLACIGVSATTSFVCALTSADEPQPESIVPRAGLAISGVAGARRGGIENYDPLEAIFVRDGFVDFRPLAGQELDLGEDRTAAWRQIELDEHGGVARGALGRGGCLLVTIPADAGRVMMLHAKGHGGLYFNGQPHTANVYGYDYYRVPVQLTAGDNQLLLRSGRGNLAVELTTPPAATFLLDGDQTLPDLVRGEAADAWGAVIVVNASTETATGLAIEARGDKLQRAVTPIPPLPPLSMRKIGFRILAHPLAGDGDGIEGRIELLGAGDEPVHAVPLALNVRAPQDAHKQTFLSKIDGSVQYYAVRRAAPLTDAAPPPALVLSCHGASVEAIGQASAYAPKSWLHLVAPTNRRPYGFDWEDLGRADAMEVLQLAGTTLRHDPARVYLTGHSMGGHGAWHLGSLFPDRFAAIGPSAGWVSYDSYARRGNRADEASPLQSLLNRGRIIGDPTQLAVNFQHHAVYVLHGDADDNVPAAQAERMAVLLEEFHRDWTYHAEPGKGHWWSNDLDDGGAACVDWPEMFDGFARHAIPRPDAVRRVVFATANPGVSSSCYWAGVEAQRRHHEVSRIDIQAWPNKRRFRGDTDNAAVLSLDVRRVTTPGPITLELDGQTLEDVPYPEDGTKLWLGRDADAWRLIPQPSLARKGPHRYGSIKNELRNEFLFVYPTSGSEEENRWGLAKARLDGETLWYRGNGGVELIPDREFDPRRYLDRTVVLYGNADVNSAWGELLADSPVQVHRDRVIVGERTVAGDHLAALFVQPRRDSDSAAVIACAGTGPSGLRLCCQQSLFVPFVRYPDCLVMSSRGLDSGRATIETAGYFGLDWSVESGEFVWAAAE